MERDVDTSQDNQTGVPMDEKRDEPTGDTSPTLTQGECKKEIENLKKMSEDRKSNSRPNSSIKKKEVTKFKRQRNSKKQSNSLDVIKSESKIKDHVSDQKGIEAKRFTENGMQIQKSSLHNIRGLLLTLWNDDTGKDISLVCNEGRSIKCHAAILACVSHHMKDILIHSGTDDNSLTVVLLPDYRYDVVEYVLRKCYLLKDITVPKQSDEKLSEFSLNLRQLCLEMGIYYVVAMNKEKDRLCSAGLSLTIQDSYDTSLEYDSHTLVQATEVRDCSMETDTFSMSEFVDKQFFEPLYTSENITENDVKSDDKMIQSENKQIKKKTVKNKDFHRLCPYCGDKFTNMQSYKYHIFREENYFPVKCNQNGCDFGTFTKVRLARHMSEKHEDINIEQQGGRNSLKQCELCPAKVRNQKQHFDACHDEKLPFPCDACGSRSQTELGLALHKTVFHTTKKYKCECGAEFTREKNLIKHIRWSCSLKRDMKRLMPIKCDHCNYRTKTSKAMRIHIARDHNEKKFECECGLRFGSKQVYSRHVRLKCKLKKNMGKTTKDLLLQCDKCPSKVLSLEEHHNNVHDEKLPFGCDACFWRSKTQKGLQIHHSQMHGDKKFKCDCGAGYSNKLGLNYHFRNSCPLRKPDGSAKENVKINLQIKCDLCDYFGRNEMAMKIHNSKDHNKNKHKCECGAAYTGKKALKIHLRKRCPLNPNYIDNLPFKCGQCPFKSSEKKAMFIHMGKEHNQNKKYECECGIKYSRKPNYLAHWRKNCMLNKNRENKILPANCPKAPTVNNTEAEVKSASANEHNSDVRGQDVANTVYIENNKSTTPVENHLRDSSENTETIIISSDELNNSRAQNEAPQIVQQEIVEYQVGGQFTQNSVTFLSHGYFTT